MGVAWQPGATGHVTTGYGVMYGGGTMSRQREVYSSPVGWGLIPEGSQTDRQTGQTDGQTDRRQGDMLFIS